MLIAYTIALLIIGFWADNSKKELWYDMEIQFKPFDGIDTILFGGPISYVLNILVVYSHFGGGEIGPRVLFGLTILIVTAIVVHFLLEWPRKKSRGTRIRRFRTVKMGELEAVLIRALDIHHLKYTRGTEGSKWLQIKTVYKTEPPIRIEIFVGNGGLFTTIRPESPEGISTAREIEKAIDSALTTMPAQGASVADP